MVTQLSGTYTPNAPLGSQQINNTQQTIETNFQDISELIGINHVPFNIANDFGKHNFVTYYNQSNAPGASTNEMVLFSQTINDDIQLYYQYPNNSTVYQLTGSTITSGNGAGGVAYVTSFNAGYQYLAGAILMQFGWITIEIPNNVYGNYTIECTFYSLGNPVAFTQIPFNFQVIPINVQSIGVPATSPANSTGFIQVVPLSNQNFNIIIENGTSITFQIFAIGV